MPNAASSFVRRHLPNATFAGLACIAALAAPPALAQSALDRVEINGRMFEGPARYDVRESCQQADEHLQQSLEPTWFRERTTGLVDVVFVVNDGKVQAVRARGGSVYVNRDVKRAVRRLACSSAQAGPSVYRLQVAFVDPAQAQAMAVADAGSAAPRTFLITASR